jgi:phage terminase large subunit-like protein
VLKNPWIPEKPHPKQAMFLMTECREVLFGGSGGGGKSKAALMGAAQDVDVPGYAALILRRSLTDHEQSGAMIDRSKEWWLDTDAKWNEAKKTWTFPSGARITFGYCESEADARRTKSSEYQYIAFDELTELPVKEPYVFMYTRQRRKKDVNVPLRMRGLTNPGGPGHLWVKKRFGLEGVSNKPHLHEGRLFIPARLFDNPTLDEASYREGMKELDPITRAQIEEGNWEAFHGGRLRPSWIKRYVKRGHLYFFGDKTYNAHDIRDRFLTVDPAATVQQTEKHDPDWTAVSAWGITPCGKLVWLDVQRERLEIPDIPDFVAGVYQHNNARKLYCEGFGIGMGPPQLLVRHPLPGGGYMNVIVYTAGGKKLLVRASEALNLAEAGRLWLPTDDPRFEEAEAEVLRFTGDERADGHDDVVENLAKAGKVMAQHENQKTVGRPQSLGIFSVGG